MDQGDLSELKDALRWEMRSRLNSLCADVQTAADVSEAADSAFILSDVYRNAEIVLTFISTRLEVDTKRIIAKTLVDGKRAAVPRIREDTDEMEFFYLDGGRMVEDQLQPGKYGILEPKDGAEKLTAAKFPSRAVIVVPGLAFAKDGFRLGKGKGYYDRYAASIQSAGKNMPAALVGLCFSCQITESVPHDAADMRVTHIASENGLYTILHHPSSTV
jgi:5-formyltetrahydrofolate cyclo-ligase